MYSDLCSTNPTGSTNLPVRTKEIRPVRLATIITPDGPRLHVRARSGYVDVAEATGDPRFSSLQYVLESGLAAMDTVRALQDSDGRDVEPADFAPATPAPPRILCLGLNYSEHAL